MGKGEPGAKPHRMQREQFATLMGGGASIADAARSVGIHYRTGRRWLRGRTVQLPDGAARHYDPVIRVKAMVSARFLSEDERIAIADLRRRGHTVRDIAARLGRAPSTVSRELRRNQAPDGGYRPFRAHRMAQARRRRTGRGKIRRDPVLARFVQGRLDQRWSPAQISRALRDEFPGEPGPPIVARDVVSGDLSHRQRHPSTAVRDAAAQRPPVSTSTSGARSPPATAGADGLDR
jgi:IS30 family transposase